MSLFMLIVSLASAVSPLTPRTVNNPFAANVELATNLPPNGCHPENGCATITNTGGSYLVLRNDSVGEQIRVVDGEGYTVGVYLDANPAIVGAIVDPTNGKTVPMISGTFVSAMEPCLRGGSEKRGYLKVQSTKELQISADVIIFTPEGNDIVEVFDINTNTFVKMHPGYGVRQGSIAPWSGPLFSSSGIYIPGWSPRLGNERCLE